MVRYKTIISVVDDYVLKCSPKYNALQYFKKHKDEFQEETWDKGVDHNVLEFSPIGHLYNQQESLQREISYTDLEKELIRSYSLYVFSKLQYYNNGDYDNCLKEFAWEGKRPTDNMDTWLLPVRVGEIGSPNEKHYDFNLKQWCENIDGTIEKSPPLQQDTVIYRYGRIPLGNNGEIIGEGNHGKFKGYTGTTYNPSLVNDDKAYLRTAGWMNENNRYELKIYAPKGTKGVIVGESMNCGSSQNEFLLGRNQKFVVLSRDDENKTAEILLY